MPARKGGSGAAGDRRLFAARRSFSTFLDGQTVVVKQGQLVDDGDPILKGRADLFEPFVPSIRNYPGRVEQATAAPGEKRA